MTPVGLDVVHAGEMILARHPRYGSYDCRDRCHPETSGCMDCSGFTSAIMRAIGLDWGCMGSFWQSRYFHQHNTGMSIAQAFVTPGAFVFRGPNEGQGALDGSKDGVWSGHVGVSKGDNKHSLEARSHSAGTGEFDIRSLTWDWAGMPPGVTNGPPPAPVPDPANGVPVEALDRTDAVYTKLGGRYVLGADGGVFAYGGTKAPFFGSLPGAGAHLDLTKEWASAIVLTSDEQGYWILTTAGGVGHFGNASYHGDFRKDCTATNYAVELLASSSTGYKAIRYDGTVLSPS